MARQFVFNSEITVAGPMDESTLRKLPQEGFRSVLNMQRLASGDLSDAEEEALARAMNLTYRCLPLDIERAVPQTVDVFREALGELPKPVYIHADDLRDAGLMVLMHLGVQRHHSGEYVVRQVRSLNFDRGRPQLTDLVHGYVDLRLGIVF